MPKDLQELQQKIIKAVPSIVKMTLEQEKLQHLASYFHEAGHREALRAINMACDELGNTIGRPILLEDVLIALDINSTDKNWIIKVSSNIVRIEYQDIVFIWLLNTPLHLQSEETISELNKLIK